MYGLPVGNQFKVVSKTVCFKLTRKLIYRSLILFICTFTEALAQEPKLFTSDLPISISILYFDQSSYQLRPGIKTALDSLARILIEQPKLMATITGYTDNVGKRELNMALAEYRAKAVETYLQQQGVSSDQIKANWEGPDRNAFANASEARKTISRRVIVQLMPAMK